MMDPALIVFYTPDEERGLATKHGRRTAVLFDELQVDDGELRGRRGELWYVLPNRLEPEDPERVRVELTPPTGSAFVAPRRYRCLVSDQDIDDIELLF